MCTAMMACVGSGAWLAQPEARNMTRIDLIEGARYYSSLLHGGYTRGKFAQKGRHISKPVPFLASVIQTTRKRLRSSGGEAIGDPEVVSCAMEAARRGVGS